MSTDSPITIGPYRISPELVKKTNLRNRCQKECVELCCMEGVYLAIHDARRILALRDDIQPLLPEPVDFDAWDLSRPANISTPVRHDGSPGQQCAFLTNDKCCALHALALEKGIPVESVKPYFCIMFPLTLVDIDINVNEIAVDNKAYSTCLVPNDHETYLYEQFASELERVIGPEGLAELRRRYP